MTIGQRRSVRSENEPTTFHTAQTIISYSKSTSRVSKILRIQRTIEHQPRQGIILRVCSLSLKRVISGQKVQERNINK